MATDKVAYWTDIANYDLETAEAMYETGRWLYVAFMCHQAIEKTLKAYGVAHSPKTRHIPTITRDWHRAADFTIE